MSDYSQKIAKAKEAGYSDAEIASYLSSDSTLAPKIQQAKSAGYSDAEILGHLSGGVSPRTSTGGAGNITTKPLPPIPAEKPAKSILQRAADNFTAPIKEAYRGLQDVNTRSQALTDVVQKRSLKDKFMNAPRDMAMSLKNTVDQGLAVGNVALSPISGAVNTITKPVGSAMSNALYDAGINAYEPGKPLNTAPLSRDAAAQQMTNNLATALSLGLPEKAGPPRPPKPRALAPKVNPDVALLRSRGVDVLPGAAKGGIAKGLEDRAAKLPVLGTKIQKAREGSVGSFNKALVDDALSPIGQSLPKDIEAGHAANAYAYDTIQQAYNANKPAQPILLPRDYADVTQHPDFGILSPSSQATVQRIIQDRAISKAPSGELNGDNFTRAVSGLRKDAKRYGAGAGDPENQLIGQILKDKLDELQGEAGVQDPSYAARKEALDTAYAKIKTMQKASQSLGADNGVITPAQYLNAIKATDASAGKNKFATGRAFNQDFAQAAKNVLSDKVANTGGEAGILGNAIMQTPTAIGGIMGGPVGAGLGFAGSTGGLYAASRAYEPAAIARFNAQLDSKIATGTQNALKPVGNGPNISVLTPLLSPPALAQNVSSLPPLLPARAAADDTKPRKKRKRTRKK